MNLNQILLHWHLIVFSFFCVITVVQVFYYLYFFRRLALYQPVAKTTSHTHPVSVIICARDEAANLAKNLVGSLVQEYKTTHEVIVVDDNSFDDSKYLLEELQKKFRQLHIVELKQEAMLISGKKFPLSMGIKAAKYEIVLLTDADCVPASEHWIEKMQATFNEHTEIVLGYGAYHKLKGLLNKIIRWETLHTAMQYMSYSLAGLTYMGVGRNMSYKKTIFFRHKGFSAHNHVASGDDDLFINQTASATNTRVSLHPDSFTESVARNTFASWLQQKKRHMSTGKYYKFSHKFSLGSFFMSAFLFYACLVTLIIIGFQWQIILTAGLLRLLVQMIIFGKCMKNLSEFDIIWMVPFFDLAVMFLYPAISISNILFKDKTWK